jgi:hypothetical protein
MIFAVHYINLIFEFKGGELKSKKNIKNKIIMKFQLSRLQFKIIHFNKNSKYGSDFEILTSDSLGNNNSLVICWNRNKKKLSCSITKKIRL